MPNNTLRIFDTTLRDGEQSPGASLNRAEKLEIARQLERLGVDVIEAGFPITSNDDFEAVRQIAGELGRATVCGLSRCVAADVDRAAEALKGAPNPRIHVFCATSRIHLEHKLKKAFEEVIRISVEHVKRARQHVQDVEFSPEDGSRTELQQLVEITAAVIEAGATTVNIPDTVGYATPEEYGHIFQHLRQQIPAIDREGIVLSSHCHDDLGLAVANSLSAAVHGARQIECTINGIGERAGNASLEEVVMALKTRSDCYHLQTAIDTKRLYPTSRMVSKLTGLDVQRNKAIVGRNAFAHEAGIHQDGMLKERSTYEIMDPRDVGIPESKLVLGKHSGRHAFRKRIEDLGYHIDDRTLQELFDRFKELADRKKNVYDDDLEALVDSALDATSRTDNWSLIDLQVTGGTDAEGTATVTLKDSAGQNHQATSRGDGPIDAAYSAIQNLTGTDVVLADYQIRSVTGGRDAQGEAHVELVQEPHRVQGRGVSTDIIEASARAYLSAINRLLSQQQAASSPPQP
ncbi:MAG: 2-isopropylmalate synthase [Phycisphaeraceae bacterium]|nr:2-isopropylmalate synthase [Phycisphaeraceae bacterium]